MVVRTAKTFDSNASDRHDIFVWSLEKKDASGWTCLE